MYYIIFMESTGLLKGFLQLHLVTSFSRLQGLLLGFEGFVCFPSLRFCSRQGSSRRVSFLSVTCERMAGGSIPSLKNTDHDFSPPHSQSRWFHCPFSWTTAAPRHSEMVSNKGPDLRLQQQAEKKIFLTQLQPLCSNPCSYFKFLNKEAKSVYQAILALSGHYLLPGTGGKQ